MLWWCSAQLLHLQCIFSFPHVCSHELMPGLAHTVCFHDESMDPSLRFFQLWGTNWTNLFRLVLSPILGCTWCWLQIQQCFPIFLSFSLENPRHVFDVPASCLQMQSCCIMCLADKLVCLFVCLSKEKLLHSSCKKTDKSLENELHRFASGFKTQCV